MGEVSDVGSALPRLKLRPHAILVKVLNYHRRLTEVERLKKSRRRGGMDDEGGQDQETRRQRKG
jgi:hypothetical protein